MIRRPGTPVLPGPKPVTPAAAAPEAGVQPRPVPRPAPVPRAAPVPRSVVPRGKPSAGPSAPPARDAGPRRGPPRAAGPSVPRPPPTQDEIVALAKRERVPARIAKGELDGKMKCRIWRKLHAEEAKRFDQVYELMEKHPGLELADGFGALQSGLTVEEFLARKARTQKKAQVKQARTSVPNEEIDAFVTGLVQNKVELAVVLAERTVPDVITSVEPVAFNLEKLGRVEKLQVVMVARRAFWEKTGPGFERDSKLAQKPQPIARQPERRPFSDPRPFLDQLGQPLRLVLRNGIKLELPLRKVGAFDLVLGEEGEELFVPLHAVVKWDQDAPAASPA